MQRICFVLQVKPGRLAEYKERHRAVWQDMKAALRETGWGNYSLFLRDDGLLVGYLEAEDFERTRAEMAKREVNGRQCLLLEALRRFAVHLSVAIRRWCRRGHPARRYDRSGIAYLLGDPADD